MQLQVDVDNMKLNIFLELLNVFKKDEMINGYKIIDNQDNDDSDIINDLHMIGDAINDAKNGLGKKTSKIVNIKEQ